MSGAVKDLVEQDFEIESKILILDQRLLEEKNYWIEKLSGETDAPGLKPDYQRSGASDGETGTVEINIDGELYQKLNKITKNGNFLTYVTLLAALKVCLRKYTGTRSVVVGSPAPRDEAATQPSSNALAIVDEVDDFLTFKQFLLSVRQTVLDAYAKHRYPFERLIKDLGRETSANRFPLFDVSLLLTDIHGEMPQVNNDISISFTKAPDRLNGTVSFRRDLFKTESIGRFASHLLNILDAALDDPNAPIHALGVLSKVERQRMLVEWNDTATEPVKESCIDEAFEAQVERTPDSPAVYFGEETLTYAELNRRANQLAHYLQARGVGAEVLVGICVERSVEMVVGLIGILKAGGAYVPLDPTYPRERVAFMLKDTACGVLLTQRHLVETLPEHAAEVVCLDDDWEAIAAYSSDNPASGTVAENAAYIIYTSGSTGNPKGVVIPHRALVNRSIPLIDVFDLDESSCHLQFYALGFDALGEEFYPTICSGGAMAIFPHPTKYSPAELLAKCEQLKVSKISMAVSYWHQVVDELSSLKRAVPESLKLMVTGGESPIPERLVEWASMTGHPQRYMNVYGPTETTILVTAFDTQVDANAFRDLQRIPIGRPLPNSRIYLLDEHLQPVPVGVAGEIFIGGLTVGRAYLQNPDLTAEKFIADPFGGKPGARMYRTGDLGCYLPDGQIEFIGRIDTQVKMRGFRIELGEIEAALSSHPSVREAVVLLRENVNGDKRLVAYVVTEPERAVANTTLRDFLKAKLPEYMVPHAFQTLERLPLTPHGKLDREALTSLAEPKPLLQTDYVAPRTEVETILADAWGKLLGVERVGVHDNFFQLGGHSLLATQAMSRVRDAFHVELPLLRLFDSPTVAGLAETIEVALIAGDKLQAPPLEPVSREGALPLSFAQQRLWFLDQLEPDSSFYNVPSAVRLRGRLDVAAFERTLGEISRRHESLRTIFPSADGDPVQLITPATPINLQITDLGALPVEEREAEARRLANEEAQRPFQLATGPLMRASLLRMGTEEHVVLFTMHHIISDGWSMGVLVNEVATLYRAYLAGEPSPLDELPIQYADYAHWQREWLRDEALDAEINYWKQQFEGAPSLIELPLDRPRPAVQSFCGSSCSFVLPAELSDSLKELSQREGLSLFMTLLAAFQMLLFRYARQDKIVVGIPIGNRNRSETEGLIGFFVNTLVLCTDLSADPTVREALGRVREVSLGAHAHQDVPFEKLVEELQPERDLSHQPLFQVMFALQNAPQGTLELPGLSISPLATGGEVMAKFDLSLTLEDVGQSLGGVFNYNVDLFDQSTIRRMVAHYTRLLEAVIADPEQHLSQLPLLTDDERHQLLFDFNNTETTSPPEGCFHELFEQQAARTPGRVALVFENQQLTYRELDERANQLAHLLISLGLPAESFVGVLLDRSLETVVSLLAIFKAGLTYLPLDPAYPLERLSFMMEDAGVSLLLSQAHLSGMLPGSPARVINLDEAHEELARQSSRNAGRAVSAGELAYLIYTSGTSGRPKAVAVTHGNLVNTLVASGERFRFTEEDVMPVIAPMSFDISLFELLSVLRVGGRAVMLKREEVLEVAGLVERMEEMTVVHMVPSLLRQVIEEVKVRGGWRGKRLRHLMTGGDVVAGELIEEALEVFGETDVEVMYGPTEGTIICTSYHPERGGQPDARHIIGKPFGNVRVRICDRAGNDVPVGVAGEIYIGGAAVTRGYVKREELTEEKYVSIGDERYYRTGDLGRYHMDGQIEFIGRVDEQVKIRGYRVELGEVETVLRAHEAVREALVLAREEDGGGDKRLVAYVVAGVAGEGQAASVGAGNLRDYLRERVPDYMIPSAFVMLDEMPLTANGKVDRRALPDPQTSITTTERPFVIPRSTLEMQLAQLWEEVLSVSPVGVKDNFFELGGHSLLAVRLMAKIQQQFNQKLPLASLFQGATVEDQAALLEQEGDSLPWSSLVALQPNGTKRPFFCVHPAGGQVLCYYQLARALGTEQPFYAWQAPDFTEVAGGGEDNYSRIEDRATAYIESMRRVQPEGPYMIGGWSFGGTVAFEIAQQLQRMGEKVGLLAQLDSIAPVITLKLDETLMLLGVAREMTARAGKVLQLTADDIRELSQEDQLVYVLEHLKASEVVPPDIDEELAFQWARSNLRGFQLRHQSFENYTPENYPGQITLLRADLNPVHLLDEATRHIAELYEDPTHGWAQLTSQPVKIVPVSGYHETMILEPHVQVLAKALTACIQDAEVID